MVRRIHVTFARRLPDKLGIYLHDLLPDDWAAFRSMVATLSEAGYRFGNADELADERPGKVVFVSFDDNHRAWFNALPLFEDLSVGVTFYINTLPLRDRATEGEIRMYYLRIAEDPAASVPLSSAEVADLAERGHTIGAHTHSHYVLAELGEEEARIEIDKSRSILAEITGMQIEHFSYPFGMRRHFTEPLREYCLKSGLRTIANAIPGMQFAGHRPAAIQRTPWNLGLSIEHNLQNLRIDGRLFERLTGRTAAPF